MFLHIIILLSSVLFFEESEQGELGVIATEVKAEANLSLHRMSSDQKPGPALFSVTSREGNTITLTPSFELSPGEAYEAHLSVGKAIIERAIYKKSVSKIAAPKVVRVLPDTGTVPANLLKFYLEFDQPMREGREIFDKIHIVDLETGKKVHSPWRRQELWSDDGKRLTVWIHPGRVKQGVNLRQQLGPVLLPGKKYELLLDASIQSPEGKTLAREFRHPFAATEEDRSRIDLSKWTISTPPAGVGTLSIQTDRPLDPLLASRHIEITKHGQPITGKFIWDKTQTRFSMAGDWKTGTYQIKVGEYLEDLAGNTAIRIFDTDLSVPAAEKPQLQREFTIK